ncbi:hypothetical protein ACM26V_00895 [Salipaludibacillus sp. HK11]|uniref:hypothetical protein n=1 Tax=Salipaludibacillus sp. HK11 TaxID=3394320 RepID=UPI0039FCAF89
MTQIVREYATPNHHFILLIVVKVLTDYAKNEWPSPTIEQLSYKTGYSEESILESMEFGTPARASLLQ